MNIKKIHRECKYISYTLIRWQLNQLLDSIKDNIFCVFTKWCANKARRGGGFNIIQGI